MLKSLLWGKWKGYNRGRWENMSYKVFFFQNLQIKNGISRTFHILDFWYTGSSLCSSRWPQTLWCTLHSTTFLKVGIIGVYNKFQPFKPSRTEFQHELTFLVTVTPSLKYQDIWQGQSIEVSTVTSGFGEVLHSLHGCRCLWEVSSRPLSAWL